MAQLVGIYFLLAPGFCPGICQSHKRHGGMLGRRLGHVFGAQEETLAYVTGKIEGAYLTRRRLIERICERNDTCRYHGVWSTFWLWRFEELKSMGR